MTEQPMPSISGRPAVQDRVIADIERRKAIGLERYGTLLQTFNGRSAARDLYEEHVDGLQYFRQLLDEWEVIGPVVDAAIAWQQARHGEALTGRQRESSSGPARALDDAVRALLAAKGAAA